MRHNYNRLMLSYYKDRVDALTRKIDKLEHLLEFKQIQIEKLESDGTDLKWKIRYNSNRIKI